MASALWVIRRCHLVRENKSSYYIYTFNNRRYQNAVQSKGLCTDVVWSETVGAISS